MKDLLKKNIWTQKNGRKKKEWTIEEMKAKKWTWTVTRRRKVDKNDNNSKRNTDDIAQKTNSWQQVQLERRDYGI